MAAAFRPMSFSLSTCHHGLNTAPDGDFFNNRKKSLMELEDIASEKLQQRRDADNPVCGAVPPCALSVRRHDCLRHAGVARC
jgi:hypothetical protein